jgi:UDP-N-acetylmuramoylalanine--D-glutamate ligase
MEEKLVVLGGGESGTGAALLAKKQGYSVFVSDKGTILEANRKVLVEANIAYEEGKHTAEVVLQGGIIVKSPGIPDNVLLIQEAKKKGIQIIDELLFAWRYLNGRSKFIAITGTNGKTTTTLLTYHLLKEAGYSVGLAGNVGKSLAGQVAGGFEPDWWVLEVSSFQLDGMPGFRPEIGVITNITPDHLDRYDYKLENYVRSKIQMGLYQQPSDYLIINGDNSLLSEAVAKAGLPGRLLTLSEYKETVGAAIISENKIDYIAPEKWGLQLNNSPLKGKHNTLNTGCAALAAKLAGLLIEEVQAGLASFKNAPHRMEAVASLAGVEYINDSKATNVDAAWYALDAMKKPIVWIVGGVDKGNDYDQVEELVAEKVTDIVCLGTDNSKLLHYFSSFQKNMVEAQSMAQAVRQAHSVAKPGAVVLLSPCCASFDLFKNYEDRGRQFCEEVLILKEKLESV